MINSLVNLSDDIAPDELESIIKLLGEMRLPTADIAAIDWRSAWGVMVEDRLIGFGGIERCGDVGLLRSIVIEAGFQRQGLARALVTQLHQDANEQGVTELYLLTTDAATYFSKRFGYQAFDRGDAPESIIRSSQFSALCPDTATLMRFVL